MALTVLQGGRGSEREGVKDDGEKYIRQVT